MTRLKLILPRLSHIATLLSILLTLIVFDKGQCQTMKAAVIKTFGTEDVLKVEEVAVPKVSKNQVLVKVQAAGINLIDTCIRNGTFDEKLALPAILGKEISGTIEALGSPHKTFKKGDRVFCGLDGGGYAEFAMANVSQCHPLHERLSFSRGAALYSSYFAAYKALVEKARLKKDESILVHDASGSLGTATVQIANCIGALIVASVATPATKSIVTRAGANIVTNHTLYTYLHPTLYDNNMHTFDAIAEVMPNPKLKRDLFYLSPKGRMVVLTSNKTVDLNLDEMPLNHEIQVVNVFTYDKQTDNNTMPFINKCVESGKVTPFVSHEYKLADVAQAHRDLIDKEEEKGKRVISFEEKLVYST